MKNKEKNTSVPLEDQTSEALAARVVAFRILNYGRDDAIKAMKILSERKSNGDKFDHVKYIDQKIKELPKPTIGKDQMDKFKSILKNVKSGTI